MSHHSHPPGHQTLLIPHRSFLIPSPVPTPPNPGDVARFAASAPCCARLRRPGAGGREEGGGRRELPRRPGAAGGAPNGRGGPPPPGSRAPPWALQRAPISVSGRHPRWPRRPASLEGEGWLREGETLLDLRPGQVRRFFLRVERLTRWVQQRSRRVRGHWQRWWVRSVGGERWSRGRAQDRGQGSGWSRGERGLGRVDRRRRCGSGAR